MSDKLTVKNYISESSKVIKSLEKEFKEIIKIKNCIKKNLLEKLKC